MRFPRDLGVVAFVLAAMGLSACSSTSSVDEPSFVGRVTNLFAGAKPGVTQPAAPTPSAPDIECPGVDIRPGASTLNVAAKSDAATAGDLRYQLSFGQTARECAVQAGQMSIKVGVQGRVILGPMGGPGMVDVPLRYAVVREGLQPQTVATRFKRLPITVSADQTNVQFIDIEEGLTFPVPETSELQRYVIYVGFDAIGDKDEKKPKRAKQK